MKIRLFKKKTCRRPTLLGWLLTGLILFIVVKLLLINSYRFLTVNAPVKSKNMIIEGWIPDYSLKKAVKLFKKGHYQNLIVTGIPVQQWQSVTGVHNVAEATAAEIKKMGFTDTIYLAGIPSTILRDRTYSMAVMSKMIFEQHPQWDKSFNIYSLGVHSRRSLLMFKKAFGDEYKIGIYADRDISFDPVHWWQNSKGFRNVGNELMAYCFVRLFFHPDIEHYKKKIAEGQYIDSILLIRQKAVEEFSDPDKTPLDSNRFYNNYHDPLYYDIDTMFRLTAQFTVDTGGEIFGMATNTARKPKYRVYGHLKFRVGDTVQTLTAYQNIGFMDDPEYGGFLFIPFRDKTNGKTTYGAGRYLDLKIPASGSTVLDFNKAYNPYCAYSDRWSCPLVPFENHLNIYILAGEKKYSENH
jgi:hypothetical protein